MGIRINKSLGWVIECDRYSAPDTEVLSEITLNDLRKENPKCEHLKMDLSFTKLSLTDSLESMVRLVDDEGEDSKLIYIFTPPLPGSSWTRHDDTMDYYEAEGMENKINYLHQEIFPYSQKFVVTKTLSEITNIQLKHANMFKDSGDKYSLTLKDELTSLGFDLSLLDLRAQAHMTAPRIIELVANKTGIKDYRILRPAIVTHWG